MTHNANTDQYLGTNRGQVRHELHAQMPSIHFPAANLPSVESASAENIQVYVRSSTKKSFKMNVRHKMALSDIKQLAEVNLGIPKEKQLLHLNGKNITEYAHIMLQSLNIIHVSSTDALLKPRQIISFKVIVINSFTNNSASVRQYRIGSDEKVDGLISLIQKDFDNTFAQSEEKPYYFLLQSSRLLDKDTSFYQQHIAQKAELICLITKHQLKTRFYNDTKEDIVHDISSLLGFDTKVPQNIEHQQKKSIDNPQDEEGEAQGEREVLFEEPYEPNEPSQHRRERKQTISEEYYEEQLFNSGSNGIVRNFRKKINPEATMILSQRKRPLLKKMKALKSQKQLDEMLKLQGNEDVFELKESSSPKKSQGQSAKKSPAHGEETQKSIISKAMPVQERRKIKLEMDKLFSFEGNAQTPSSIIPSKKEEEEPKSPPTEEPPRIQKRKEKMQNLRSSMSSRPAFLNGLKIPQKL